MDRSASPALEWATLDRPGCRLAYRVRDSASGQWVLLLHGAGMDGHMFDAQLSSVPDGTGIVVWDARGHGRSELSGPFRYGDMLDDLHALVAHVAPRRLVLVGQSMGGNLAQGYVALHPEAVHALVLIDCTNNHGPLTTTERWALRLAQPLLAAWPWPWTVRQSARACGTHPDTVAYATRCLQRMGKRRFVEVMGFWDDCLTPDPAYRLPCPTQAVVGQQDRTGNVTRALTRLAARDPRVTLTTVAGAGHNANMDQPGRTNEILGEVLTSWC